MILSSILYHWKKDNLNHGKGKRSWRHANWIKIKSFTADPRILFHPAVKNITCKNIIDFEVNCCDWKRLNDQTICALCKKEAIFTSCDARIILEQDLANKIVTSKHSGVHICSKQVHERKEGVEKLI